MIKKFTIVFFLIIVLSPSVFAEKVVLKSGQIYEGTILDRNDRYVTLQTGGAPVYLPLDQIDSMDDGSSPSIQTIARDSQAEQAVNAVADQSAQQQVNPIGFAKSALPTVAVENGIQETHVQTNPVVDNKRHGLLFDGRNWELFYVAKEQNDDITVEFSVDGQNSDNWIDMVKINKVSAAIEKGMTIQTVVENWMSQASEPPHHFEVIKKNANSMIFKWHNKNVIEFDEIDRLVVSDKAVYLLMYLVRPSLDAGNQEKWANIFDKIDVESKDLQEIFEQSSDRGRSLLEVSPKEIRHENGGSASAGKYPYVNRNINDRAVFRDLQLLINSSWLFPFIIAGFLALWGGLFKKKKLNGMPVQEVAFRDNKNRMPEPKRFVSLLFMIGTILNSVVIMAYGVQSLGEESLGVFILNWEMWKNIAIIYGFIFAVGCLMYGIPKRLK